MEVGSSEVLALVRDLLFGSKIAGAAKSAGTAVRIVREPGKLAGVPGRLLLVDLALPGAIEAAAEWQAAARGQVVGFVSHVDAETIGRAKQAGIGRVLSRGQFVQVLGELVRAPAS